MERPPGRTESADPITGHRSLLRTWAPGCFHPTSGPTHREVTGRSCRCSGQKSGVRVWDPCPKGSRGSLGWVGQTQGQTGLWCHQCEKGDGFLTPDFCLLLGKQLLLKLKSNCPLKRGPIHLLSPGGGEGTGDVCPKDSPQSRMTPLENSSSRAKQYGREPPKRGGHPRLVPGTASKSFTNTLIQRRKQRPLPLMSGCLSAEGPCARVISDNQTVIHLCSAS